MSRVASRALPHEFHECGAQHVIAMRQGGSEHAETCVAIGAINVQR